MVDPDYDEQWQAFDAQAQMIVDLAGFDEKLVSALAKQRSVAFRAGWAARGVPVVAPATATATTSTAPRDPREGMTPVVQWLDPGERAYVVPLVAIIEKASRVDRDAGIDGYEGIGEFFIDLRSVIYSEASDQACVCVENRDGKFYASGPRDQHRLRELPVEDRSLVTLAWLDG